MVADVVELSEQLCMYFVLFFESLHDFHQGLGVSQY